ncbi:MAG: cation:proton antiporter [Euryarchaeota archaeon]|nr:cation:proton antiporter [Euryarchaeota archaeon]
MLEWELIVLLLAATLGTALVAKRTGAPITALEIVMGVVLVYFLGVHLPFGAGVLATFGSLLIVFLAGLETRIEFLKENWRSAWTIGLPGFAVPALVLFFLLRQGLGAPLFVSVVGATALADTSISIVYTTLHQYRLANLPFGRMVLAATLVVNLSEDATITSGTLLYSGLTWTLLAILGVLLVLALFLPRLIARLQSEGGTYFANIPARGILLSLAAIELFTSLATIPGIFFVFLMGLVVSRSLDEKSLEQVQGLAFALFVPLYFVNVGLNVDLPFVLANLPILLGLVAVASTAKISALLPGLRRVFGTARASKVAVLMNTRLTSATVILLLMLENGFISDAWYSLFISGVVVLALGSSGVLRAFQGFSSAEAARQALGSFRMEPAPSGATS